MVNIPFFFFLFLYMIFIGVFAIVFLINVYHIVSTGTFTLVSFFVTALVAALAIFVIISTFTMLSSVAWTTPITIFDMSWFSALFSNKTFGTAPIPSSF